MECDIAAQAPGSDEQRGEQQDDAADQIGQASQLHRAEIPHHRLGHDRPGGIAKTANCDAERAADLGHVQRPGESGGSEQRANADQPPCQCADLALVKRSCPNATANPSRAIGVNAELMTAARPAVMYFRP